MELLFLAMGRSLSGCWRQRDRPIESDRDFSATFYVRILAGLTSMNQGS